MFVSFRSIEEAVDQAKADRGLLLGTRKVLQADVLIVNQGTTKITQNYQVYLDYLVKEVGAVRWNIEQLESHFYKVSIIWKEAPLLQQKVA